MLLWAVDPQRVENAALIHAGLFVSYPEDHAKRVSRAERESKQWSSQSLVYGEIPFETIKTIFELVFMCYQLAELIACATRVHCPMLLQ